MQSHVAFILDDLAKKAVSEIITLFDNTFAAFIEELCKKQNEIDQLKKKLESPADDVNTAENIMQEKLSALSSFEEFSVRLQTSNEEDVERKSSSPVTQWDFPDEQQYEFEGKEVRPGPAIPEATGVFVISNVYSNVTLFVHCSSHFIVKIDLLEL